MAVCETCKEDYSELNAKHYTLAGECAELKDRITELEDELNTISEAVARVLTNFRKTS